MQNLTALRDAFDAMTIAEVKRHGGIPALSEEEVAFRDQVALVLEGWARENLTGPDPKDPSVTRHVLTSCPNCHHPLNAIGTTDGAEVHAPAVGDGSACIACGCPLVYIEHPDTHAPGYRRMTEQEFFSLTHQQQNEIVRVILFTFLVYQPREAAQRQRPN